MPRRRQRVAVLETMRQVERGSESARGTGRDEVARGLGAAEPASQIGQSDGGVGHGGQSVGMEGPMLPRRRAGLQTGSRRRSTTTWLDGAAPAGPIAFT